MPDGSVADTNRLPKFHSESWAANVVVYIGAAVVIALAMTREVNMYDEGIVLSSAAHMMRGEMIHRDYLSVYGPGSYAVLAMMFWLFGKSFIVARIFSVAVTAGIVTASFDLLRTRVRPPIAIGTSCIILGWMIAYPFYLYPLYPCLLLILLGSIILLRAGAAVRWRPLLAAGACAGLNAYFRYDVGFVMLVAHIGCIMLSVWFGADRAVRVARGVKSCFLYGVGAGIVFLPGALYFLANAPVSAFIGDIVVYGTEIYPRTRRLPFPGLADLRHLGNLGIYFPIFSVIIGLPLVVAKSSAALSLARARREAPTVPPTMLLTLLTVLLYYKGTVRVETMHMLLAIVPATMLMAFVVDRWWVSRRLALRALAVVAVIATSVPAAAATRSMVHGFLKAPRRFVAGRLAEEVGILPRRADIAETCLARPGMRGAWLSPEYALAARFLVDHTRPDEPVLIATDRHDRVFANPITLYFAADRRPATRWDVYDPGYHTRADIQQTIVRELVRNDVRWIVEDASFDVFIEPNDSAKSSGVTILDRYIAANYRPIARADGVVMWLRKDVEAPAEKAVAACRMKRI